MYATADDMRARYEELPLVQLTGGDAWDAVVIAKINVKIAAASARADGYVAKYYAPAEGLPIPPLLTEIVCEIAYADLHKSPTEEAEKRRKAAIADLRDISNGKLKLDQGRGDLPARAGALIVPEVERTFSRNSMAGF